MVEKRLRYRVLERDGFTCRYCGRSAPDVVLHVDHRWPQSKGGLDTLDNLATACEDCNRGKRDDPIDWATHPFTSSPFDHPRTEADIENLVQWARIEMQEQTLQRLNRLPITVAWRDLDAACYAHLEQLRLVGARVLREPRGSHEALEAWAERTHELQRQVHAYEFPAVEVG